MWKEDFQSKYMGGKLTPKFKLTIAKAFELVAVIGPALYWRYGQRSCTNYAQFQLFPELFGSPEDPTAQQIYEAATQELQRESAVNYTRNSLMELYLNYSQREQPGGLAMHSELAITEALITGRGLLWVEPYTFPDSQRTLTGCFYDSVHNFFIDPDSSDPLLMDAKWIARKHITPWWELEKKFGLPSGSLREKGSLESAESQAVNDDEESNMYRQTGKTFDLVVWYEIWSKGGVGTRMKDVTSNLDEAFENTVGDYAYLCIAKGVDYPLNAPTDKLRSASDEEVKEMFAWPTPTYKDDRWPVAILDFYRKPNACWPLAPMAMGLGELMFLNVMISVLCDRAYSTSRNVIAYFKSAAQQLEADFKSGKHEIYIELNDAIQKSVQDVIQFVQQPAINYDIFRMIEVVSEMFDKRVGLTDLVYGLNPGGVASRTATDINAKQENLSIRPEYMSGKVEAWQSEAANLEKFVARWHVDSETISPLLGKVGSKLWEQLITDEDPEIVVREMHAMVEAGSVRRPNRQKDIGNLQGMAGWLLPELSKHADITSDTAPLNAYIEAFGRVADIDVSKWVMGAREPKQPEMTEEMQQQQQEAMQIEQARIQYEQQKSQMDLQAKQVDIERKRLEAAAKKSEADAKAIEAQKTAELRQLQLEFDREQAALNLQQDAARAAQDMDQARQRHALNMQVLAEEGALKLNIAEKNAEVRKPRRPVAQGGQE
jgi:hypothetical protein